MTRSKILIVAAAELEIRPLIKQALKKKENTYQLSFNQLEVEVLISGVGISSITYHLTKQLQNNTYDLVILAGIAGSYTKDLKLGDVVLVQQERFADLGLQEGEEFADLFSMGLLKQNEFPFENGWLKNNTDIDSQLFSTIPQVSGNTINTLRSPIHPEIQSQAKVESMEGAAFFQVCKLEKQSFVQIRAISNYVGETDKMNWDIPLAVENLNRIIASLFA